MKSTLTKVLAALLLCFGIGARADNIVTIGTASGAPSDEVTLSIAMQNSDNIAALQLLIPLDEELSFVEGSAALTDRCGSHSVTAGMKDGELSMMIYSLGMAAITGMEGDVATFRLKLGNQPKNITLSASKLILTDTEGNSISGTAQNGLVSIRCAKAQFVNEEDDGIVTIGTRSSVSQRAPVGFYRNFSCTDILFTAQQLRNSGIEKGQRIASIRFVSSSGTGNLNSLELKVWVGTIKDEKNFTAGDADKSQMKEFVICNNESVSLSSPYTIELDLSNSPIEFDGDNGIRIMTEKKSSNTARIYYAIDNNYKNSFYKESNDASIFETLPWSSSPIGNPLAYFTLDTSIPHPIDFGAVPIHNTYQKSLIVRNVGNEPLEVTGLQFANYVTKFSSSTQFPLTVAAGGSANINITYAPEERGTVSETVKVLCNSISKLNNITLKAEPFAVNELHVQPAAGVADETVTVALTMNNMDAISGFQFEFNLPAALEYVPNSFQLSGRKQDHAIVATVNDGLLRIIGYSPNDKPFTGEDGELATMQFVLRGRNNVTLKASKCLLTATINDQVTNVCSADYGATITIKSPRIYAASTLAMGATPVTQDAMKTLSVRNQGSAPLIISRVVFDKEDFYVQEQMPLTIEAGGTATLTVVYPSTEEGDYETTMQLYSNDPEQRVWNVKVTGNRFAPNYLSFSAADIYQGDPLAVEVALSNYDAINGIQFDVEYPSNYFEPIDELTTTARAAGLSVSQRIVSEGVARYFFYSLTDAIIEPGDGKVLTMKFAPKGEAPIGNYQLKVTNIKLGTPDMVDKYAGGDLTCSFKVKQLLMGDINNDGSISIADVTALVNILLGNDDAEPYKYNHKAANVNGDEDINSEDVTALVSIILGE